MKIVFIDDQEDIRELLAMILEENLPSAIVVSFSNITEAKSYIDSNKTNISLIISDYQLKGENGLSLYGQVKDYKIPFFLMTGMSFEKESFLIESFTKEPINKVINKPVNEEDLINEINKVL